MTSQFSILETPRWLASKNRYEDAKQILNKISQINLRPRFNYKLEGEMDQSNQEEPHLTTGRSLTSKDLDALLSTEQNYNYFDLFR